MEPKWVDLDAFSVIGMAGWFDSEPHLHIPKLWDRFGPRIGAVPGALPGRCLGICHGTPAGLLYVAAVPVESLETVPLDMVGKTVPAAHYAVFTHRGPVSELHRTIADVWKTWLPGSAYEAAPDALDFELYDERFAGQDAASEVDYYVPVRRRS